MEKFVCFKNNLYLCSQKVFIKINIFNQKVFITVNTFGSKVFITINKETKVGGQDKGFSQIFGQQNAFVAADDIEEVGLFFTPECLFLSKNVIFRPRNYPKL